MGLIRETDFVMQQIEMMQAIWAKLLGNGITIELKETLLTTVDEGMKVLNLTIDELRTRPMEEIIKENPDTQILFLMDSFLDVYLQLEPDPAIQSQRNILLAHLHETAKTCTFSEFLG